MGLSKLYSKMTYHSLEYCSKLTNYITENFCHNHKAKMQQIFLPPVIRIHMQAMSVHRQALLNGIEVVTLLSLQSLIPPCQLFQVLYYYIIVIYKHHLCLSCCPRHAKLSILQLQSYYTCYYVTTHALCNSTLNFGREPDPYPSAFVLAFCLCLLLLASNYAPNYANRIYTGKGI